MQFPPGDDIADALRDALESGTRRIYLRVEFDWNRDGNFDHLYSDLSPIVQSVSDDRQVTGDLPEQVNTLVGYASAEMTLKLAGERRHGELPAHQMFSPYLQTSPLPRKNIIGTPVRYSRVVETALGDVPVRQFTGWIREFQLEREDNIVTVIASDVLDLTTSPVTLPQWARFPFEPWHDAVQDRFIQYDDAAARTRPIDMTWVVEEAFRQGGSPSGPPTRPSAVAYWSCNGSYLSSVGTADDVQAEPYYNHSIRWQPIGSPPFRNGIYGLESMPSNYPAGDENSRRKNQGLVVSPKVVQLPVDGGPSSVTLGFNAWVSQESTNAISDTGGRPYNNFRYLSAKYYFRRDAHAVGGDEQYLTLDHVWPSPQGSIEFYVFPTGQARILCRQGTATIRWWWLPVAPAATDGNHLHLDIRVAVSSNGTPSLTRAIIGGVDMLSSFTESGTGRFTRPAGPNIVVGQNDAAELMSQIATIYTSIASSHVQLYLDSTANIAAEDAAGWDNPEGRPSTTPDGKPRSVIPAGAQMDVTHFPSTYRVPAWDLLKQLSSAEFAVMHTDEWGTKYWVPNYQARIEREHALSMADERGLLIRDERLLSFMVNPSEDQYRNTITVGFNEKWCAAGTLWEPVDWRQFQMVGGADEYAFIPVDNAVMVPSVFHQWPYTEGFEPTDHRMFRYGIGFAVYSDNSSATATGWTVRIAPPRDGRRGFFWRRRNQNSERAIQFTGPPDPSTQSFKNTLWVQGWRIGEGDSGSVTVSDEAEVAERGIRELVLEDNPWRSWQGLPGNGDGAYGVAESLLKDTITPAPLIDGVEIPADPRLQLRDVVALTSEGGITGRIHAEVIGIHRTDTATESKDRLTLRVIETPGQWELGVPGLSELSETTTLG